jgi:hypothetical protein
MIVTLADESPEVVTKFRTEGKAVTEQTNMHEGIKGILN